MAAIGQFFVDIWNNIVVLIFSSNNGILDILDIAVVTFIIYKAIQFMRQTRAEQLLKGILVFLLVYVLAELLNLKALLWIVSMVYVNAIVVFVVLFQPELRAILERLGRGSSNLKSIGKSWSHRSNDEIQKTTDAVCKACQSMQNSRTGALIVIERETKLSDIALSGTIIDAIPSKELICNIFFKNSALHDGAMIIRDDKIHAAACILPLTKNIDIDSALGTRHRAAIGISENSDALVIVVSEETGVISVAEAGHIQRNFNSITLKTMLKSALIGSDDAYVEAKGIKRLFVRKGGKDNGKK